MKIFNWILLIIILSIFTWAIHRMAFWEGVYKENTATKQLPKQLQ